MVAYARWWARGEAAGELQAAAIRANLERFRQVLVLRGRVWTAALDHAARESPHLPGWARAELRGMAATSGVPVEELVAFNLLGEAVEPEGCSVALAMPDATRHRELVFFKNSDKMGSADNAPDRWHLHKEINVVRVVDRDEALGIRRVIGVAAAGSTIFKMGLNDAGLAGGASLGRIVKASEQTAAYWGAAGRGELLRDGLLRAGSAEEAASMALPILLRSPVASPGNIQFADPSRAVNLECSFGEIAAEWIAAGTMVRTNRFELMRQLNRTDDVSSPARFTRAADLLNQALGAIDADTMVSLSMDHANGPGPQSLCRHSDDWREETSLSSAVMRVSPTGAYPPEIAIALGKPCRAWAAAEGDAWIRLTLDMTESDVPQAFLSGEAWKRFYSETPGGVPV
jgi:hypothetical protein